jgi:hypothetical protein
MFRVLSAPIIRSTIAAYSHRFLWFCVLLYWSRYWFGTPLHLSMVSFRLVWEGFARQIVPETCRANDERNKEYSVHLVGTELNIYITKMFGTTNIK